MKGGVPRIRQGKKNHKDLADRIRAFDSEGRIASIIMYGSHVTGTPNPRSDIDVAVHYQGTREERFAFRRKALGRLDDAQDLPVYLQKEIIVSGTPIYIRDYDIIYETYTKTIQKADDFKKYFNVYMAGLREATG